MGVDMATIDNKTDELTEIIRVAAGRLSAESVARLASNPTAVATALAATASTLGPTDAAATSIGSPPPVLVDDDEVNRKLDARSETGPVENLLTSDDFARRAGAKTRQSVHDWFKKRRVVGWERGKRGLVFPAGQLDERGRPIAGLEEVIQRFPDGYAAWVWLTTPNSALEGDCPLEMLRTGQVRRVVAAADGYAQGDFA